MTKEHFVKLLFALLAHCLLLCSTGCAKEIRPSSGLTTLTSWKEIQTTAQAHQLPIVLLVEQRHCAFCQALKREVIRPLASDALYGKKAIFVSMLTDYDAPLFEKDGKQISGFDFAQSFDATTTPTILFLDASANELQERIVGYIADATYIENVKARIEFSSNALQ